MLGRAQTTELYFQSSFQTKPMWSRVSKTTFNKQLPKKLKIQVTKIFSLNINVLSKWILFKCQSCVKTRLHRCAQMLVCWPSRFSSKDEDKVILLGALYSSSPSVFVVSTSLAAEVCFFSCCSSCWF